MQREYRINSGDLRHPVTIYSRTATKSDETGADVETWTEVFAQTRANMNPEGGRKVFDAGRFNGEDFETAEVRYRAGITTTMRLKFRSTYFEILDWDNIDEMNVQLMLQLRRIDITEAAPSGDKVIGDVLVIGNVTDFETLQETT